MTKQEMRELLEQQYKKLSECESPHQVELLSTATEAMIKLAEFLKNY